MAQPPKLRRLSREDFPEADEKTGPILDKLFLQLNPFVSDVGGALSKQLLMGDNVAADYKTVDVTAPVQPWITVPTPLSNSWVALNAASYNAPAYRITPEGRVYVRGAVKDGTDTTGTVMFTLPSGYRPSREERFVISSNGVFGEVAIQTDGDVVLITGDSANVFLDNISFDATSPAPVPAFTGTGWPISFTHSLPRPPQEVRVARAKALAADSEIALTGNPDWTLDLKGNVIIRSVPGLTPGRKYRLTFCIQ